MRQRAAQTQAYSDSEGSGHYGKSDIKEAAKDIKSWIHGCIQIAVVTILYGFGTFLPIIIRDGFHYSVREVLLFTSHTIHNILTWTGAIPGDPRKYLGRHRLRDWRISQRPLPNSLRPTHSDGTNRYSRLRHPPRPRQSRSPVFRHLPHLDRMFPLHRRKHNLALCQLRA